MSHIFVSYSRKDKEFVRKIVTALEASNFDVWIDLDDLPKGEDWELEIYRNIDEAEAFLFMFSPDSVASKMCNKETAHAVANGKRILPIVLRDAELEEYLSEDTKVEISKRNWIFCREERDDFETAITEILETIHTDYEWLKYHTQLQVKALEWERTKDASRLLRGKELQEAEDQLTGAGNKSDPAPTNLQRQFILASARDVQRRRRWMIAISFIAVTVMSVLGIYAQFQANLATNRSATAQAASTAEAEQAATAVAAQKTAVAEANAKATALVKEKSAQATAQTEKERADEQAKIAREQAKIARAGELAARAQTMIGNYPQRGVLLGLEAVNTCSPPISSAEQALRDTLRNIGGIPIVDHEGDIQTLGISPDGHWLVIVNNDNAVLIWDIQNPGSESLVIIGKENDVIKIEISPDTHWLAAIGTDGSARVWDLQKPYAKPIIVDKQGDITYSILSFSLDGRYLAVSDTNKTIHIWQLEDSKLVLLSEIKVDNEISIITLNADGHLLAIGSPGGSITIYDLKNASNIPVVLSQQEDSDKLVFTPDARWLVTSSKNNVTLWEIMNPATPISLGTYINPIFSSDGRWLAAGNANDTSVEVVDLQNANVEPITLPGEQIGISIFSPLEQSGIRTLAFSPDGRWLATSSYYDSKVRIWDLQNKSVSSSTPITLQGQEDEVTKISLNASGRWLVAVNKNNFIRLWDVQNPAADPILLRGYDGGINKMIFSPDGHWLAVIRFTDLTLRVWNLKNLAADPITPGGDEGDNINLTISPDGDWLAAGSYFDRTILVWDLNNLSEVYFVLQDQENPLAFSRDGKLATFIGDTVYFWDMQNPSSDPMLLKNIGELVIFSSDGRWVASPSIEGNVRVWNMLNPMADPILLKGYKSSFYGLAFSQNGRWLGFSDEGSVMMWDMLNPTANPISVGGQGEVNRNLGHEIIQGYWTDVDWLADMNANRIRIWNEDDPSADPISLNMESALNAIISPDNHWLAVIGSNNTLSLKNLQNLNSDPYPLGEQVHDSITIAFSNDSNYVLTMGKDGKLRLWHVQLDGLVDVACSIVGRNLTQAEWQQYFPGEEYRITCPQWPAGE